MDKLDKKSIGKTQTQIQAGVGKRFYSPIPTHNMGYIEDNPEPRYYKILYFSS